MELFSQNDHSWNNPLPIPCQRQCFDTAAKQMQKRYEVARVKTDGQFGEHHKIDRRERGSKKGSKNIEIYLVQRTAKAGRKISGQTGVAMFTSATYVWTFIWRCLNEMWHQHQIYP